MITIHNKSSVKDIIEYYTVLVYVHTKWSEAAAEQWVFLAVGEYHLSSHNSIVLLYSMSIFYHQTTALSYAEEKERKMPGATSTTTVLSAGLVNCTVLSEIEKMVQWQFFWKDHEG